MSSPFFSVLPGHDLFYNEIVKPTRRWAFSYYYLNRWLPLLHPQQAMLIQVLRQSTWQNGKPTGRCQLANGTLCEMMGWSESSHKTLLAELERPYTDWFVRRTRTRKSHVTQGHAVEGAPHYRVMMDDPLTPHDQAALRVLLATVRPTSTYQAAEQLSDLSTRHTRELWALLDEQRVPDMLPEKPATVREIAAAVWSHLPEDELQGSKPFAETAEQLQLRVTGAGYAHMELDYMLQGWLPELGINNTWLTIVLRARCFHNPHSGETRDVVTLSRKELEEQLNIPTRTFRRMLRDEATVPLFHISPAGEPADPANPRNLPHRGDLSFTVAYPLLPISSLDREQYEALLVRQADNTMEEGQLSTTGQLTQLERANQPGCPSEVIHNRPINPAQTGQSARLNKQEAANEPGSNRPINPAQLGLTGQPTRLEPANQPDIQRTTTTKKLLSNYQNPPITFGRGGGNSEKERIRSLLEPFQIKGLSRVLENPGLTAAETRAWIYRGQDEVEAAQMSGYLFRRLCTNSEIAHSDPLPTDYRLVGAVEDEEQALFEQWWLAEQSYPPFTDSEQRARYAAWLKIVKQEEGDPDRPDFSPHACWRREMERARLG
ncbi:MAG: hypothetical protein M3220_07055 [Chloroflexota bacterium]|nr:hypothetical protein [Chloroflexota bacterium]